MRKEQQQCTAQNSPYANKGQAEIEPIGTKLAIFAFFAIPQYFLHKSKMAEAGTSQCEQQKTIIGNLLKNQLKKGDTW